MDVASEVIPREKRLDRRQLHLLVLLLGCLNGLSNPVVDAIGVKGFWSASLETFGVSFVVWLAIVLASRLLLQAPKEPATWFDTTLAFLCCLAFLIPSAMIAFLVTGAYAILQLLLPPKHPNTRAALIIFIAIVFRAPLIQIIMLFFGRDLLTFDALLASHSISWVTGQGARFGNIIEASPGHTLVVLEVCSPFTNISLALLAWLAITRSFFPRWRKSDLLVPIGLTIMVIFLNTLRLTIMGFNHESYVYMHEGFGKHIYEFMVLLVTLGFVLMTRKFHVRAHRSHQPL